MDDDRFQHLTRRIEHAGERIVDVLKRVETELGDRAAVEVSGVESVVATRPETAAATAPDSTSRHVLATRSAAAHWRRFVFVSALTLAGAAVALRLRTARR